MRKIYLIILALFFLVLYPSKAQVIGINPGEQDVPIQHQVSFFTHGVDSVFQYLSRTRVTTGILYDRVMPLAGLHVFNTGLQPDTASASLFFQAYLELRNASFNPTSFPFNSEHLRSQSERFLYRDSIALGVLDYQFNRLDTLALEHGLITLQNGLFYDVPNPSRSPYLSNTVTIAAALIDTVAPNLSFYLPSTLLLGNRPRSLTSMTVDCGQGTSPLVFTPGQRHQIYYNTGGKKVLTYVLNFTDGSQTQCRSYIFVRNPLAARSSQITSLSYINAEEAFGGYDGTEPLLGRGEVLVVLHNTQSQNEYNNDRQNYKLRNPLVILDGYDAGDVSGLRDLSAELNFYKLVQDAGILTAADLQERDVILLNFPNSERQRPNLTWTDYKIDGGTDYIERNALVLVALLKQFKRQLATSSEKYAIIGPSMGGLISRYALAYMEKRQYETGNPVWDHNTSLWISLDAPHQGANVPLGVQEFLRYYQDVTEEAQHTLNNSVNSPATKQMLVHHHLARTATITGAPGFRDRFMQVLRDNGRPGSLGYPELLRRVSITDGRLDGGRQAQGTPGGLALQMDIVRYGTQTMRTLDPFRPLFFYRKAQAGTLAIADINFSPAYGSATVFRTRVSLATQASSLWNVPLSRTSTATSPTGSYDLAAGGYYNAVEQIKAQATKTFLYTPSFKNVLNFHCFIPAVSALAYQYHQMSAYQNSSSLPDPNTNLYQANLQCQQNTPFDRFYGLSNRNLRHVIEPEAGVQQFLFDELLNRTQQPSFSQVPQFLCPNQGPVTFVLTQTCQRPGQQLTYTWVLSGELQFSDGTRQRTTTSVQQDIYASVANGYGSITVTATRPGASVSAAASVNVYIGGSPVVGAYSCRNCGSYGTLSTYQYVQAGYYYITMEPGDYTFTSSSSSIPVTKINSNTAAFTLPAGGSFQVSATQNNTASGCPKSSNFVFINSMYFYGPNPANDELNIEMAQDMSDSNPVAVQNKSVPSTQNPKKENKQEFTAELYDNYSKLMISKKSTLKKVKMDTRNYPAGLYILRLISGDDVQSKHIQIIH